MDIWAILDHHRWLSHDSMIMSSFFDMLILDPLVEDIHFWYTCFDIMGDPSQQPPMFGGETQAISGNFGLAKSWIYPCNLDRIKSYLSRAGSLSPAIKRALPGQLDLSPIRIYH